MDLVCYIKSTTRTRHGNPIYNMFTENIGP